MTDDEKLDAAVDEAAALRGAIDSLIATIMSAAPKEEKRYKTLAVLAIVGGPLLFVVTMTFAFFSLNQTRDNERITRTGVACLLADLDDHSHTNQLSHETLAERHGFGKEAIKPNVTPLTQEQAEQLKKYCEVYVKASISGQGFGFKR